MLSYVCPSFFLYKSKHFRKRHNYAKNSLHICTGITPVIRDFLIRGCSIVVGSINILSTETIAATAHAQQAARAVSTRPHQVFNGDDYEECRLLGCYGLWLL
jgi:hypothetical protein